MMARVVVTRTSWWPSAQSPQDAEHLLSTQVVRFLPLISDVIRIRTPERSTLLVSADLYVHVIRNFPE